MRCEPELLDVYTSRIVHCHYWIARVLGVHALACWSDRLKPGHQAAPRKSQISGLGCRIRLRCARMNWPYLAFALLCAGFVQGLTGFGFGLVSMSLMPVVIGIKPVSYTHLRAHETPEHLVCRL